MGQRKKVKPKSTLGAAIDGVFGATPEEICSRVPEPNRPGCLRRMREMFREAKRERVMSSLGKVGVVVALAIGGFVIYKVAKEP